MPPQMTLIGTYLNYGKLSSLKDTPETSKVTYTSSYTAPRRRSPDNDAISPKLVIRKELNPKDPAKNCSSNIQLSDQLKFG